MLVKGSIMSGNVIPPAKIAAIAPILNDPVQQKQLVDNMQEVTVKTHLGLKVFTLACHGVISAGMSKKNKRKNNKSLVSLLNTEALTAKQVETLKKANEVYYDAFIRPEPRNNFPLKPKKLPPKPEMEPKLSPQVLSLGAQSITTEEAPVQSLEADLMKSDSLEVGSLGEIDDANMNKVEDSVNYGSDFDSPLIEGKANPDDSSSPNL